jgi:hypothetical protein
MLKQPVKMRRTATAAGTALIPGGVLGLVLGMVLLASATQTLANGYGESGSWGFQTQQDKVNKAFVLDMIEKRKNGFYNAIKSTYNYNTYNYNCCAYNNNTWSVRCAHNSR